MIESATCTYSESYCNLVPLNQVELEKVEKLPTQISQFRILFHNVSGYPENSALASV